VTAIDLAGSAALRETAPGTLGRPGLAVVTFRGTGDGIAYEARLLARTFEAAGAPATSIALEPARAGTVTRAERLRFTARVARAQLSRRVDWLLFNHVGIARAQAVVPPALRRPYAVMLNGVEAWDPALPEDRKQVLRDAALRISISPHTARRVEATHPDVGPVIPCLLALLPDLPSGAPDDALLSTVGSRDVLIVGRMSAAERYKGHDELLEAWPAVRARVPGARLLVAGRGDDVERLRAKATALGIDEAVRFLGFVDDATLYALFGRIAAFAMPSRGEGFGLVYLEAMRQAVPCIGSVHDAAADLIVDGVTGRLVDQDDRGALADAIVTLLGDDNRRRAMGEAGRRRFHEHFAFERYGERLLPLLAQLMAGRGAR
jgi:phosphatidyl-myo-inositol dimannoside synthase